MNTKKRVIIIILLAVFTACCYISSFFILKESLYPHGKYIKDENYTDCRNEDSNLTLFNDKLYFSKKRYAGDFYKGGLYEIGANGSKLVIDDEKNDLQNNSLQFYLFKNNLITFDSYFSDKKEDTFYKNAIYKFDTDSGNLIKISQFKGINYITAIFTDNDTLYLVTEDKLYASKDLKTAKYVFDLSKICLDSDYEFKDCYSVQNGSIIYISRDYYIYEYNFIQKKFLIKKKIPKKALHKHNSFSIYKIGKDIILENDSDKNEVYNVSKDFKLLFNDKDFSILGSCGYKNKLFLSSYYNGIYLVDIDSGKSKKIFEKEVNSISVFGDKWIYFTDENYNLSRVTQDGKYIETVFS